MSHKTIRRIMMGWLSIVCCSFCFIMPNTFAENLAEKCRDFGTGVSILPARNVEDLNGDFNGDGKKDVVLFLHLVDRPVFQKDVRIVNKIAIDGKERLAIGILLMGKEGACKKYVIYNDVFSTWDESVIWGPNRLEYPAGLVTKKSDEFHYWKKRVKKLKYDALSLESEDGLGEALIYWNGGAFVSYLDKSGRNIYEP